MENKIIIFLISVLLIISVVVIPNLVFGKVPRNPLPSELLNGKTERVGNYFEIENSQYLNITLRSTEEIKIFLESIPKVISLNIKATKNDINYTELILGGLEPGKNYYKYQDSYKNKVVFISDDQGSYAWTQDLADPHHIWFQEALVVEVSGTKSKNLAFSGMVSQNSVGGSINIESSIEPTTIFLPDMCSNYGTWNADISTCVLSQDLSQNVEITQDDIILDCNNNTITNYGIYLFGRTGVTIKNCQIFGGNAIFIDNSSAITLDSDTIKSQWEGVGSYYSTGTNIRNCKITSQQSNSIGFYYSTGGVVTNNNFSGEIDFYNSSNNNIENNTVTMGTWECVWFGDSDNNKIAGNTFSCNNAEGLGFYNSNNNEISGNTIGASKWGVDIYSSSNDVFTNNNIKDNEYEGIGIYNSSAISFSDNNISSNGTGFGGYSSSNIKIYHNNFVGNHLGAETYGGNYLFDDGHPSGGNYWSDYSGVDLNDDGMGDTPYVFNSGQDNYPFIEQDGWQVPPEPSITPVLIVPGLMGTELKKGNELLWVDLGRMFTDIGDNFLDALRFHTDLSSENTDIITGSILGSPVITQHFYDLLINEFKNQGYTENQDLFTFPYDWRYGVSGKYADGTTNSDLLSVKIQDIMAKTGSDKVDVIAHSLGGLITKQYVINHQADNHIGKAVFVGVPNTGAPKAVKALLQGDNFGIPWLADSEIKKISANMPASYDLLPSQQYYDTKGSYIKTIDQTKCLEDFTTPCDIKDLNHQEANSFLSGQGFNSLAISGAENLHTQSFDNFDLRTVGIDLYAIDGCKSATLSKVVSTKYNDIFGQQTNYDLRFAPGDGTVPFESATNLPINQGNKFYFAGASHSKMLSADGSRQKIVNLISGSNIPIGDNLITQDISKCNLNGKAISVFSPVNIFVTDQDGNKLGLADDGSVINEITNADFEMIGEHKFLFLPQDNGQTYNINLQGIDTGIYTIKSQNIASSQIVNTEVFSNLPVTMALTGEININPIDNSTTLSVKQNPNDVPTIITPSAIIDATASEDVLPPISIVTLSGVAGQLNFYRSSVSVNIKTIDDLSGALDLEYNLDNVGYQKILGDKAEFTVSNEGEHTIKFFSTDKAGNKGQEQTRNFTIDKTAPEAVIQFDLNTKDLKFTGTDNISDGSLILVQDEDDVITLTDQAGNIIEIKLKDKNRKILMSAEVKSIKYNGTYADISKNKMAYLWLYDKNKNIKMVSQHIQSKKGYNVLAIYNGKNTSLIGKDSSGRISKSFPGLKIIKVTTNNGDLSWAY